DDDRKRSAQWHQRALDIGAFERCLRPPSGLRRSGDSRNRRRCAPRLSRQSAPRKATRQNHLCQRALPPRLPALAGDSADGGCERDHARNQARICGGLCMTIVLNGEVITTAAANLAALLAEIELDEA